MELLPIASLIRDELVQSSMLFTQSLVELICDVQGKYENVLTEAGTVGETHVTLQDLVRGKNTWISWIS